MAVTVEQVQQLLGRKELEILEYQTQLQSLTEQVEILKTQIQALENQSQIRQFPKEVEKEISDGMGSAQ